MSANGSDELSALREQRRIALQQQLEEQAKVQADAEMETQKQIYLTKPQTMFIHYYPKNSLHNGKRMIRLSII